MYGVPKETIKAQSLPEWQRSLACLPELDLNQDIIYKTYFRTVLFSYSKQHIDAKDDKKP